MFEELLRELERLGQEKSISIPIKPDADGYIDKECPNEECKYQFKVHGEDWSNIFKDEAVFCPLCGHSAVAENFTPPEQINEAAEYALKHIEDRISRAMHEDAEQFNRSQPKYKFLKLSMHVKGDKPQLVMFPISSSEELRLKIQCKVCKSRYAVIGCGYFCPSCGHNSIERLFHTSLQKIRAKIKNIDIIRAAIAKENPDEAEITYRSLIESALTDCVVAFQRYSEHNYKNLPNAIPTIPMNVFQRVDDGSALWKAAIGEGYEDWLTDAEFFELKLLFQKRHLLSHTEGIVDERYVKNTGDNKYNIGQRIIINVSDVERALELIGKITERFAGRA